MASDRLPLVVGPGPLERARRLEGDASPEQVVVAYMNAFTAIVPDPRSGFGPAYDVNVYLDPDGEVWIAESDALPLATEAPTLDALLERVWLIAPEIAELNGHKGDLNLRFPLHTVAAG